MKVLGIHFAPLWIPLERRLQTLAALGWVILMLTAAPASWFFFFWAILCSPWLRVPCIFYVFWMYWDRSSVENGNRRSNWVRNWRWWKWFQAYFPVRLVKTSELSPDRSYLFAAFPHGIFSIGPLCSFCTDSTNFQEVFPGLTPRMVSLNFLFQTPFFRELCITVGVLPAIEDCMVRQLSKKGNALCLMPGGVEEGFYSKPGQCEILVARRKGFIRVALKAGASIVPTFVFGETEVYDQIQCHSGSFLRWFQDFCKKLVGFAPIYLKGRGIFQYTFGFLPFRSTVTVVAGRPIHVNKVENPTKSQINELHATYCTQLIELYNSERNKYLANPKDLIFIQSNKDK